MDSVRKKPSFFQKGHKGRRRDSHPQDEQTGKIKKRMELRQDTEFGW